MDIDNATKITIDELGRYTGHHDGYRYIVVSKPLENDPEQKTEKCDNIIWGSADNIEYAKDEAIYYMNQYNELVSSETKQEFSGYSIEQCNVYDIGKFAKQIMVTVCSENPIPDDINIIIDLDEETMNIAI